MSVRPVGWAALGHCRLVFQAVYCLSGRRCEGREAAFCCSEPALAHWVLGSPSARRANQLQRCNSRTPFLTTAFSHFALPLTTPVCLSCWTLFFLLPTCSLPSPTHPAPDPHPISSVTDCLAITLHNFAFCLYPVITLQTANPKELQPSFTIFLLG